VNYPASEQEVHGIDHQTARPAHADQFQVGPSEGVRIDRAGEM